MTWLRKSHMWVAALSVFAALVVFDVILIPGSDWIDGFIGLLS